MSDETMTLKVDAEVPLLVSSAAVIVSAYVGNNHVQPADLPALIVSVHAALSGLGKDTTAPVTIEPKTPAEIRKSITPDALISFLDGKGYKTLKRHLSVHGLTPEGYRAKFGLPQDYPMTAASYSAARSDLAKSIGLGLGGAKPANTQAA